MAQTLLVGRKKLNRVKRNITLPPNLAEAADADATDAGRHLSHLIEDLLAAHLDKKGVDWRTKPPPLGDREPPDR